jgi:hypothetical protein
MTNPVGVRTVDVTRGTNRGDVAAQWFSRPDDQRFLSLTDLLAHTAGRRDAAVERRVAAGTFMFQGSEDDPRRLAVTARDTGEVFNPTHHVFGQVCQLAKMGRATEIFRGQPGWLAGLNLSYGLSRAVREEPVKLYADGRVNDLMAVTGPDYGRIYDASVVEAVMKFAGTGTGDTPWKVPGIINWGDGTYNPYVDVTKETTTLFASDRDAFVFLVDDTRPIEVGKLPNGDPDLIFRGFYAQNSEVGTRSLKIATFWLRAVCQNRNLWGVEDFDELRIVHSKYGMDRFAREAEPTLQRYATSEPTKLLAGISAAKQAKVAGDDEERVRFLTSDMLGFSLKRAHDLIATGEREEGHKPETVWDFTQAITALARTIPHQDARLEMEATAAKLMDRAARSAI